MINSAESEDLKVLTQFVMSVQYLDCANCNIKGKCYYLCACKTENILKEQKQQQEMEFGKRRWKATEDGLSPT